jgi:hypothetical protein
VNFLSPDIFAGAVFSYGGVGIGAAARMHIAALDTVFVRIAAWLFLAHFGKVELVPGVGLNLLDGQVGVGADQDWQAQVLLDGDGVIDCGSRRP